LANTKSAIKSIRQNERRRVHNRVIISRTRTALKKARTVVGEPQTPATEEALKAAVAALDSAVTKGVLHRNNAARRKSRLMRQFAQTTSK
jgi:small subunit ribosomal protein S20